jgi:hypothetical protein
VANAEERILGALDHFRAASGTSRYDRQLHAIRRTVDAVGERMRVTEL